MIEDKNHSLIPPFCVNGSITIRGTLEWEIREHAREHYGATLVSFGLARPPGKRVRACDVSREVRR